MLSAVSARQPSRKPTPRNPSEHLNHSLRCRSGSRILCTIGSRWPTSGHTLIRFALCGCVWDSPVTRRLGLLDTPILQSGPIAARYRSRFVRNASCIARPPSLAGPPADEWFNSLYPRRRNRDGNEDSTGRICDEAGRFNRALQARTGYQKVNREGNSLIPLLGLKPHRRSK